MPRHAGITMPRAIAKSVVVVTGASSGIGRATALEFARRGATVVLAARRSELLDEVANACEELGARALAVPTDVTDEEAVRVLAARAVDEFGRIDVWVNNAGVTMFAPFEEAPAAPFRRVIETNFFGYVHGARAALPVFRRQGEGVLINDASVVGRTGEPHTSAYVASKFAIRGLAETLRMETMGTDIHVCDVLPASIDTPLFQHAANYTGRVVKPLKPVYPAEDVADAIVGLAESPQREVTVGRAGRIAAEVHDLAPNLFNRVFARMGAKGHYKRRRAEPTEGNLFEPMREGADVSGGWRRRIRIGATAMSLAAVGAAALRLRRRRGRE